MGVERAVTRWHIQQQQILNQISALETKLAQDKQTPQKDLVQQLNDAHKKLRKLGPCPKPMMG